MRFAVALHSSLTRFLLVGAANTAVGLGVILAAKRWANLGDAAANLLGYGVGLAVSFTLNKKWTFRWSGRTPAALRRFLLVFAAAYAANLVTVLGLIRAGVEGNWAQVCGVAPYTLVFYVGSRLYAFSPTAR
jgi:putative flippase GtrA